MAITVGFPKAQTKLIQLEIFITDPILTISLTYTTIWKVYVRSNQLVLKMDSSYDLLKITFPVF